MEAISKERVASVTLVQAKFSEDELALYEAALSYALATLDEREMVERFGATVEEMEGMRDDLREVLQHQDEAARAPEPATK